MTIKELEERTGMIRANIRYYEQEGLLAPARKENGYRSYSEEDCENLLKIKLLRQLQFSLQEIRDIQSGALSLSQAMEGRSALLERESGVLLNARDVCRTIEREVADYAALDPLVYLRQLSAPRDAAAADVAQPHPWRRYFARSLDVMLAGLAVTLVRSCVLHQLPNDSNGSRIVSLILAWVVLMLTEPFLLHFWGTTVGKWIWGIRVVSIRDGKKLSLNEAFSRTGLVFACGEGASIPLVNFACNGYSYYRYVKKGEPLAWEGDSVEQFSDRDWKAPAGYVLTMAAVFAITLLAGISVLLPPNRGGLTVAEFAENYNYYRDLFDMDTSRWLDEAGHWQESPDDLGQTISISFGNVPQPDFVFTTEDGTVTAVSYHYTLEEESYFLDSASPQLCYISLAAAQKGTHLWSLYNRQLNMDGWDPSSDRFSCSWRGVSLDYQTQLLRDMGGMRFRPGSTVSCTVTVEN